MLKRYEQALEITANLLRERMPIYSPIVHCHELALKHDLPKDAEFWWSYNKHMIDVAEMVLVLELEGWENSTGVAWEIAYAMGKGMTVDYIEYTSG